MKYTEVVYIETLASLSQLKAALKKSCLFSSLTATRDHHTISAILQSRFDSEELPGE